MWSLVKLYFVYQVLKIPLYYTQLSLLAIGPGNLPIVPRDLPTNQKFLGKIFNHIQELYLRICRKRSKVQRDLPTDTKYLDYSCRKRSGYNERFLQDKNLYLVYKLISLGWSLWPSIRFIPLAKISCDTLSVRDTECISSVSKWIWTTRIGQEIGDTKAFP